MNNSGNSNFRGINFYLFITILVIFGSYLILPSHIIDTIQYNEYRAIVSAFGTIPLDTLGYFGFDNEFFNELYQRFVETGRYFFAIDPTYLRSESEFVQNLDALMLDRLYGLANMVGLLCLRASVVLFCLLVCCPAFIASMFYGISERQRTAFSFSYTSPFKLKLSLSILKILWACTVVAFFIPWFLNPHLLPSLIAILACYTGLVLSKLQKQI